MQQNESRITAEQRAEISRRNGAKSHGPVTPDGKARASRNALKHGVYTRNIVLANERADIYLELRDNYLREWEPVGERETDLVIDIVNIRWRMSRLVLIETATLDCAISRQRDHVDAEFEHVDEGVRTALAFTGYNGQDRTGINLIGRAESRLQRQLLRTIAELRRLQSSRLGPSSSSSSQPGQRAA